MGVIVWTAVLGALGLSSNTALATGAERFRPNDPDFIVWRADATDRTRLHRSLTTPPGLFASSALELARRYVDTAREQRDARFFGRAEALLARQAAGGAITPDERVLLAEVRQFRHDFGGARRELDLVLEADAHHDGARLQRASIALVQGAFANARSDCVWLTTRAATTAAQTAGKICLAQALAATGRDAAALQMLSDSQIERHAVEQRAYAYAVRGEAHDRAGRIDAAIGDYARALRLAPHDDATRTALADLLFERGGTSEATQILAIERPGVALLVRQVRASSGVARNDVRNQVDGLLELERRRGDALHLREAAYLALHVDGDAARALDLAQRNFAQQRELADVRLLAAAAIAARDRAAQRALQAWIAAERYHDRATLAALGPG